MLVTGGAGFIGSSLADRLVQHGAQVRVLDNFLTGRRDAVPEGAELVEADLRDESALLDACADVDVVFHQAAVRSVPRSLDEPQLVNECNVTGTLNLLMAAEKCGVRRFVYASSSSVYGEIEAALNQEHLAPDPSSPYASSKLAGEYYCRVWSKLRRLDTISLRYFNVFGPGQRPDSKYAAVFPGFISALLEDRAPEVHWDGEQSRDFTYIGDVVTANIRAAEASSDASGHVVNIGSGSPKTVNQVLKGVADALGKWIDPEFRPKRGADIRRTHADIDKAKNLLGWTPEQDWESAIEQTVEWFRSA